MIKRPSLTNNDFSKTNLGFLLMSLRDYIASFDSKCVSLWGPMLFF